jgi:hypothetical protein
VSVLTKICIFDVYTNIEFIIYNMIVEKKGNLTCLLTVDVSYKRESVTEESNGVQLYL